MGTLKPPAPPRRVPGVLLAVLSLVAVLLAVMLWLKRS
jgi:hypothetical protein